MKKRLLSMLLAVCLVVSMLPVSAMAAMAETGNVTSGTNSVTASGTNSEINSGAPTVCENHTEHSDSCGYAAAGEGASCTHACALCQPAEKLDCTCQPVESGEGTHVEGCPLYAAPAAATPAAATPVLMNTEDLITITINRSNTLYSGATLEAAVDKALTGESVAISAITELTITAGTVTGGDWTWFAGNGVPVLSKLSLLDIASAVTPVAPIPAGAPSRPIFPLTIQNVFLRNITDIGAYAFEGCTALATASFPKATSIGASAFNNCGALANLKLGATPPTTVAANAFEGCPKTTLTLVDAAAPS